MAEDLPDQVNSKLNLQDKSNDEIPSTVQTAGHSGSDGENDTSTDLDGGNDTDKNDTDDDDKDKDDVVDASADDEVAEPDPEESDLVKELRLKTETCKEEFLALPEDSKEFVVKGCEWGDSLWRYYAALPPRQTNEPWLGALRIITGARNIADVDSSDFCTATYYQATCCVGTFDWTKDKSYLLQAADFCRESIKWLTDHDVSKTSTYYDLRCGLLAKIYSKLNAVDPRLEYITAACVWQGRCVDGTNKEDYGEDGETTLYLRYKDWVSMNIRLLDQRPDVDMDPLINQINKYFPCTLKKGATITAHNYWHIRLTMFCRRWARDSNPENFAVILQNVKELLAWENDDRFCPCCANRDDPAYSTNPNNPQHLIRRVAGFFDDFFDLENENSEWYNHPKTIEVSIALWDEAYKSIPRGKFSDVRKVRKPIQKLWIRSEQKYDASKEVRDGWRADSREWESAIWNTMYSRLEEGLQQPNDPLEEWITQSKRIAIGQSHVTRQKYGVYGVLDYKGPWNLDTQRFKFLQEDDGGGKWTLDNWIRERSDDGTFVLGGAIKGRDDDVLEFLEGIDRSKKSMDGGAEAQNDGKYADVETLKRKIMEHRESEARFEST